MYELTVLSRKETELLQPKLIIDRPFDLVWVERFSEAGELSLVIPATSIDIDQIETNHFLTMNGSESLMLIEDLEYRTDEDGTDVLSITGSEAEKVLDFRRTEKVFSVEDDTSGLYLTYYLALNVWGGNFRQGPPHPRRIPNWYVRAIDDLSSYTLDPELRWPIGTSCYDLIIEILNLSELGIKSFAEPAGSIGWGMYAGTDRSHQQTSNPQVTFSKLFENLLYSSYYLAQKGSNNVVMALTDGVDASVDSIFVWDPVFGEPEGFDRKEGTFSVPTPEGLSTTAEEQTYIENKSIAEIRKNRRPYGVFDGSFDINGVFKYGVDFNLGDYVTCVVKDKQVRARMVERIVSINETEIKDTASFDFDTQL